MKKTMLILLATITVSVAHAQINKGAWLLSAASSMGFNSYSYKNGSGSTQFNLTAKAGYFLLDNWAIGLNVSYLNLSQSGATESVTSAGVFTRYYIPKNFFLGAGINAIKSTSGFNGSSSSVSSTAIPFEFGFAGFVTNNIALEPSIGYTIGDDKSATSTFGVNLGISLYLNRNSAK